MNLRTYFPGVLALTAIVSLLLRPVFCDLLHAAEELASAGQASHFGDRDGEPAVSTPDHCCGGHGPAPVFSLTKVVSVQEDAGSVPIPVSTALFGRPVIDCSSNSRSAFFITPILAAQGILRALLCRWIV